MRMIGNYLQIAVRILRRQKLLSAIEVCSLSLAFGFCVLAYTLVSHEWSYDRFHENGARRRRAERLWIGKFIRGGHGLCGGVVAHGGPDA